MIEEIRIPWRKRAIFGSRIIFSEFKTMEFASIVNIYYTTIEHKF